MNFHTAIYNRILEPKYFKVYNCIEAMNKSNRMSVKTSYKKDIIQHLADIIYIKDEHGINYTEDLKLLEKYNK